MAQPIHCDDPECAEEARILTTDLESGQVSAFCSAHYAGFCLALAIETIGPEQILATVGPIHVARQEESAAEQTPKRRGRARSEAPPAAEAEGPTAGPAEMETAAPDG